MKGKPSFSYENKGPLKLCEWASTNRHVTFKDSDIHTSKKRMASIQSYLTMIVGRKRFELLTSWLSVTRFGRSRALTMLSYRPASSRLSLY